MESSPLRCDLPLSFITLECSLGQGLERAEERLVRLFEAEAALALHAAAKLGGDRFEQIRIDVNGHEMKLHLALRGDLPEEVARRLVRASPPRVQVVPVGAIVHDFERAGVPRQNGAQAGKQTRLLRGGGRARRCVLVRPRRSGAFFAADHAARYRLSKLSLASGTMRPTRGRRALRLTVRGRRSKRRPIRPRQSDPRRGRQRRPRGVETCPTPLRRS